MIFNTIDYYNLNLYISPTFSKADTGALVWWTKTTLIDRQSYMCSYNIEACVHITRKPYMCSNDRRSYLSSYNKEVIHVTCVH